MDYHVYTYEDKGGKWRWRYMAGNGNQIARSPSGYIDEDSLMEDMNYIVSRSHDADIYKDKKNEWRWRFSRDGKIIAIASEGYKNRGDCVNSSDSLLDAVTS